MEIGEKNLEKMENPNNGEIKLNPTSKSKPKVLVIMGATGSGKSKLAIDLASYFPIEIINADSMQVYQGLDVLTNKVTPQEQKGVPHHLLGTISAFLVIYTMNADYTKGLRQAIGVREFEPFLRRYILEHQKPCGESHDQTLHDQTLKQNIQHIVDSPDDNEWKALLTEAIEQVKLNTRRLVRRQRRRLNRLQMLYGWDIHYVDATKSIISSADDIWAAEVVKPSVGIIKSFLTGESTTENGSDASEEIKSTHKDLWTQHVCEACGNKVLRGSHEWEQHRQGRGHRKRVYRLKKSGNLCL
ncbi:tRNA dimethylallyltransferase 2 [Capsicum chinense]|nr:tRNA dimethylallyltransferase 2 [Capsicum chinense]